MDTALGVGVEAAKADHGKSLKGCIPSLHFGKGLLQKIGKWDESRLKVTWIVNTGTEIDGPNFGHQVQVINSRIPFMEPTVAVQPQIPGLDCKTF